MGMIRPRGYKDIKSKQRSLPNFVNTRNRDYIGLEESTISYFAFMSQLVISIENPNNCKTS